MSFWNKTAEPEPPQDSRMKAAIRLWSRAYRDGTAESGTLKLPSAIASELARLTVCELESRVTGKTRAEFLNGCYQTLLKKLRRELEYALACGGMVFKPYPEQGTVKVDCIPAGKFRPLGFTPSGVLTGAVFWQEWTENGISYLREEQHTMERGRYFIRNRAYRRSTPEKQEEIPLETVPVWKNLSPRAEIKGLDAPLFTYFRTPFANPIQPGSPLGTSVYARAMPLIRQAEEQWERILWEYRGSELAVDASEDLFRHTRDGRVILPQGQERLFRAYDFQVGESGGNFLSVFSPQIRDSSLFRGLNEILKRIEFLCGLAYGTLSDPQMVEKTAEEIRAGKQRSYATVADLQAALQSALEQLVRQMDVWTSLAGLAPRGEYSLSFRWDDSIISDSEAQRRRDLEEVREGILEKWEFRMKWYGEPEEIARRNCP